MIYEKEALLFNNLTILIYNKENYFHKPRILVLKRSLRANTKIVIWYNSVFFFHKDDITIRFRFSPSSDANWC